jgi:multicomponent Na+:H+ antiporter subunit C
VTVETEVIYGVAGAVLFGVGAAAVVGRAHLLRKILGVNIAGSGVFLVMIAIAFRGENLPPDPVPHAMVLTGIVVAVCGTALAVALAGRVKAAALADAAKEERGGLSQRKDAK